MKTIIAGSRSIRDYQMLLEAIKASNFLITEVISGHCSSGVDKLGEQFAKEFNIPLILYPADWNKNGKSAGHLRNTTMSENAEALIAVWDGKSKGTLDMIKKSVRKNLNTFVYIPTQPIVIKRYFNEKIELVHKI